MLSKNFIIYPNTFSNKHSTPLSLKTILTGSLDFNADPIILQNFIYNGYKCNFFDSMFYLSQPYIKFLDNSNAKMPSWVLNLYTYIGAFFAQSRWFRLFVGNIDPFKTDNKNKPFAVILEDLNSLLTKDKKYPYFNIIHFGANHFGDLWYRINDPAKIYMGWYEQAIEQLQKIISNILGKDKNALIVAVGDHGAYHWRGVSGGSDLAEKNAIKNGVELDALAYDFFGVLLGIYWGNIRIPAIPAGISHVNIFRWIFTALSGKESLLTEPAENISIYEGKYITVRDGKPLTSYELLKNKKYSDYYQLTINSPELLESTLIVEKQLINNQLESIEQNAEKLYKLALNTTPITLQHFNAAQSLVKCGKVIEGTNLLDYCWKKNSEILGFEPYVYLVNALLNLGNYERANEILTQILSRPNYPHRQAYLFLIKILWRQKRYNKILDIIPKIFNTQRNIVCDPIDEFAIETTYSYFAIARLHGGKAAIDWLDKMLLNEKPDTLHYNILLIQKILLFLKYDEREIVSLFQRILSQNKFSYGFALLYLQLLIKYNHLDIANNFLEIISCFQNKQNDIRLPIIADPLYSKTSKEHFKAVIAKKTVIDIIQKSGMFDDVWYAKEYPSAYPPLIDYVVNGIPLLHNPNPKFDIQFYLSAHPFVFSEGADPLIHYIVTNKSLTTSPEQDKFFYKNVHPAFCNQFL